MSKRGSIKWRANISRGRKGIKSSPESLIKRSLAMMGHRVSKETRLKISIAIKGKSKSEPDGGWKQYQWGHGKPVPIHTKEQHRKIGIAISKANKGRILPKWWRDKISKGMKRATSHMTDTKGMSRKEYTSVHNWMKLRYGKPKLCEQCGVDKGSRYNFQWANISGNYLRDRIDWKRLCANCHRNFDLKKSIT